MMENTSPSPYQYGPARRRRMPLSMPKATSQQNRATEPGQELSEAGQPLRGVGQKRPAARNEPSPDGLSPTREDTPPSVEESGLERAFQDEPSASDADSTRAAHGTGEGQRHGDARQRVRYLVPVGSAQRIALVLNLLSWGIDVDQRGDELTVTGSPAAHDAVRSVIRLWEEQDETKD